jgi:hypothetical protein
MIVEFIDGTTATIISFVGQGYIGGTISDIQGYISHMSNATHIAVMTESGNTNSFTRIYPISKVLCVHKDLSTIREKKIDNILE